MSSPDHVMEANPLARQEGQIERNLFIGKLLRVLTWRRIANSDNFADYLSHWGIICVL